MLRDDGVGVIEYTEQLTYLLFLTEYSWQQLLDADGAELEFALPASWSGWLSNPAP